MWGINFKDYRQFLTKNERNKVYLRKNNAFSRAIADNKYKTKKYLAKFGVGVPKLIARIKNIDDLVKLNKELKIMLDKKNKQTKKDECK